MVTSNLDPRIKIGVTWPLLLSLLLALGGQTWFWAGSVAAADKTIDFEPQIYAIRGQDLTMDVKVSSDVDDVVLNLRRLAELGEFTEFTFTKKAPGQFSITLPLTTYEDFNWERLEYFLEAKRGGQRAARTDSYVLSFIEQQQVAPPVVETSPAISEKEFNQLLAGVPIYKTWWFWAGATIAVGTAVFLLQDEGEKEGYTPPSLANFRSYIDAGDVSWPPGEENGTKFFVDLPGEAWLHFSMEVQGGKPPFNYRWDITSFDFGPEGWVYKTETFTGSTSDTQIVSPQVHYVLRSFFQYDVNLPITLTITDAKGTAVNSTTGIRFFVRLPG